MDVVDGGGQEATSAGRCRRAAMHCAIVPEAVVMMSLRMAHIVELSAGVLFVHVYEDQKDTQIRKCKTKKKQE